MSRAILYRKESGDIVAQMGYSKMRKPVFRLESFPFAMGTTDVHHHMSDSGVLQGAAHWRTALCNRLADRDRQNDNHRQGGKRVVHPAVNILR